MDRPDRAYEWTDRDKLIYLCALIPFLVAFVGALALIATISVYWSVALVAVYLLGNFFQAGCCIGCPYRGRYCPALFGIFLASFLSARLYGDRKHEQRFFDRNAALAETTVVIISICCCLLLFAIHWVLAILFLALGALHLYLFFSRICPKCAYNQTCRAGRAAVPCSSRHPGCRS
jgi:hypothetical protein